MRIALSVVACALLASSAGAQSRPPAPAAAIPAHAQALRAVQSLVDDYVRSGKLVGVTVAIGRGDAPATFITAGTLSDQAGAPRADPDSLWRIYSMTKPITAMAAMILIEQGKLGLNQPISDLIPAFRSLRVLDDPSRSLASHPANRPVTVRHLLTHSSGLSYPFLAPAPLRAEYERLGLLGGRAGAAGSAVQPATLAEFAERAARVPLLAEPGTHWNYSIGTDVLGRVIEVASGMPLDRFVQMRILDPLGMRSTFWTVPASQAGRLATSFGWNGAQRVALETGGASDWLNPPRLIYGGSGLVSSARDYDRFLQMLAGGGKAGGVRVLKPATVRLALSNLLPKGVRLAGEGAPDTVRAEGFGAGGWVYLSDVPGGVGAGTYGWFGVAGTIAFIDPRSKLRVTVMTNYFPATRWPLHADMLKALYRVQR